MPTQPASTPRRRVSWQFEQVADPAPQAHRSSQDQPPPRSQADAVNELLDRINELLDHNPSLGGATPHTASRQSLPSDTTFVPFEAGMTPYSACAATPQPHNHGHDHSWMSTSAAAASVLDSGRLHRRPPPPPPSPSTQRSAPSPHTSDGPLRTALAYQYRSQHHPSQHHQPPPPTPASPYRVIDLEQEEEQDVVEEEEVVVVGSSTRRAAAAAEEHGPTRPPLVPLARPIAQPPAPAYAAHGLCSAARSVAYGEGLHRCYVHRPALFMIQARDGNGENCRVGGDAFAVKLRGPIDVKATVRDLGDGTHEVAFTVPVTGEYLVHATLRHKHLAGSPYTLHVTSGVAQPSKCRVLLGIEQVERLPPPPSTAPTTAATGAPAVASPPPLPPPLTALPNLAAGDSAAAIIETRDALGRRLTHGGEHLKAWLRPADDVTPASVALALSGERPPAELAISDLRDGLFSIRYRVFCAGRYLLEVRAGRDEPIGGTPLPLTVMAGRPHPPATTLHGSDLEVDRGLIAGEDAHFVLVSHDAFGNPCESGGARFEMSVRPAFGPAAEPAAADRAFACDLLDRNDGTYAGSFRANRSGPMHLLVSLDGEPVALPTAVTILPAATHAPSCVLTVAPRSPGARSWRGATPLSRGRQQQQQQQQRGAGGGRSRRSSSASSAAADPTVAPPSPFAKQFFSEDGTPLPRLSLEISEYAELIIEARDAYGNPRLKGGDTWHVDVSGPAHAEAHVDDRGDGTYGVRIACTVAGEYTAAVSLQVPLESLRHPGGHPGGHAGGHAGGQAGGSGHGGNGRILALANVGGGGALPASTPVSPHQTNAASALLPVPHPPLRLNVAPGALSAECSLQWPSTAPTLLAGQALTLTLLAADRWGNALSSLGGASAVLERQRGGDGYEGGGEGEGDGDGEGHLVPCTLTRGAGTHVGSAYYPPSSSYPSYSSYHAVSVASPANGGEAVGGEAVGGDADAAAAQGSQIVISACPVVAGVYVPRLTIDGYHFRPPDPSYAILVRPSGPSNERSHAVGIGLEGGLVGKPARFHVVQRDAYGNPLRGNSDRVRVLVRRAAPSLAAAIRAARPAGGAAAAAAAAAEALRGMGVAGVPRHSPPPRLLPPPKPLASTSTPASPRSSPRERAVAHHRRHHHRYDEEEEEDDDEEAEADVIRAEVEDGEDGGAGHVRVSFVPRLAGTHSIYVLVNGADVRGSPFTAFFSAGELSPPHCVARGDGLHAAVAGRAAIVEVVSYDVYGNVLGGGGGGAAFSASLVQPDGAMADCVSRCLDRGDGTYRLVYTAFAAGSDLRLHISSRGVAIRGSPFALAVTPGRAHAAHCHVEGAGATYAPLAPKTTSFLVRCADRWDNRCVRGGEKVTVRSTGPSHPLVSVEDLADGSYRVTTRYALSGEYRLSVCLAQQPGGRRVQVAGSPFTVYAGLQLDEQHYLVRWLSEDVPRAVPALPASDATTRSGRPWQQRSCAGHGAGAVGGSGAGRPWRGSGSSSRGVGGGRAEGGCARSLAVASLGTWHQDREAVLAHAMRAWKLAVGRAILERMVAGTIPDGSPRMVTSHGAPVVPSLAHVAAASTALAKRASSATESARSAVALTRRDGGGVGSESDEGGQSGERGRGRDVQMIPQKRPQALTEGMLMIQAARGRGKGHGGGIDARAGRRGNTVR